MKISENQMTRHEKLTRSAQQMVANTFYGTLLKQMRQSPFHSQLFDGGRGGEAFNQLFDQKIAEKMAGRMHNHLVDAIVKKFEKVGSGQSAVGSSRGHSTASGSPALTPALSQRERGKSVNSSMVKKAYGIGA